MKNKTLIGLIATATIGTAIAAPTVLNNQNTMHIVNKVLMMSNSATNEAVVVNGNSNMNLYALSNGKGIISNLSVGEMLTTIGKQQGNYCKVRVQETGAVGYINISNMQNILNGTSDSFTQLSKGGQIINVSSNVRLRSNPSISNNVITNLSNGTQFNILGKQGQWYKVSVNGQIGFIYEEYVSTNIANVLNNSKQSSITSNVNKSINNASSNSNISSTNINTNSNSHVKNIIVRTKSNKQSSSHIDNMQTGGVPGGEKNTNKNESKKSDNISSQENNVNNKTMNITLSKGEDLYLFASPNSANIVDSLKGNIKITLVKQTNQWSYIKGKDFEGYIPNNVLKAAVNGNNILDAYKIAYLSRLSYIQDDISSWPKPSSTNQALTQSYKASQLWGNELNTIENNLLYYLSTKSSNELKQSQEKWIKSLQNDISKMKQSGGNVGVISAYNKASKLYKNRCVYLLNEYM